MKQKIKFKELPPIQIFDLGNGLLQWHKTSQLEQACYELYQLIDTKGEK